MKAKLFDWTPEDRERLRLARALQRAGEFLAPADVDIIRRYWRELKRRKKEFAPDARVNPQYREWCALEGRDPKLRRNWKRFLREGRSE